MRLPGAVIMASAVMLVANLPASAATYNFDWSYTGGPGVSGSGTLQATYDFGDQYTVTLISGTANGQTIVGLSSYNFPDQLVYSPSPPDIAVDSLGVSFSVGSGATSYQIYEDDGLYTPGPPYGCGAVYCLIGPGNTVTGGAGDPFVALTSFTLTPTPLPAALPLFATGLGALGLFGWRRKLKNASAVAAA
jgi:hypothetical protein